MSSTYYSILFSRLLEGKLSPEDTEALISWLSSDKLDIDAAELILQQLKKSPTHDSIDPNIIASLEASLPKILGQTTKRPQGIVSVLKTRWFKYAAAVLILIGIGSYLLLSNRSSKHEASTPTVSSKVDVAPGKNGAILTLEDGRKVILDETSNGLVTIQSGSKVVLQNDQLVYDHNGSAISQVSYNTLSTPKGRQFKLLLPDGSEVWLNAASSIRYPTVFTGSERKVEITGEAYFEVAKNPAMPFRVKVNEETEIEVLGTHFNINSYDNEASINTTLLEGSVNITCKDEKVKLNPGQQARISGLTNEKMPEQKNKEQQIKIMNDVNVEKVMAWKNGVFDFEDAKLEEVMRQLERWYDIEVVYEKNVPQIEFVGKMGRDLTLLNVLRGLQVSKVHFRLEEGRKLMIMP